MRAGSSARPRPEGRLQAAVLGQVARQGVGRGGLQQLQGAIEVGLPHSGAAHEHVQVGHRMGDRFQRAELARPEFTDRQGHGVSGRSFRRWARTVARWTGRANWTRSPGPFAPEARRRDDRSGCALQGIVRDEFIKRHPELTWADNVGAVHGSARA